MILMKILTLHVTLLSVSDNTLAFSMFEWFDWTKSRSGNLPSSVVTNQAQVNVQEGITLISIPFEELNPEDKFLQEAERLSSLSLSGLDTCEHRIVIKLQASCSDMTEEELAKLSIGLLNCQSEVSGRSQIICTDDMSLKECTAPMESEAWTAYHTINNRARAVCYIKRQQQFRALSEMTVNKLMSSAHKQLDTMDNLEELQKELSTLTADTMSSLNEGQHKLLDQNRGLQLAQQKMRDNIVGNLKQLTQERSVIQSTHNQLKKLSEKLSHELEEVWGLVESHSEQHQDIHQQILSTLTTITAKTDAVWSTIDEKSQRLLQQQDKIQKATKETLENLKRVNDSVNYLLGIVNHVKSEVDKKLTWATDAVGGDGNTLLSAVQHSLYLLAVVLVSLFLQLSLSCRLTILLMVLLNFVLGVTRRQALSFIPLSGIIVGMWAAIVLAPMCWLIFKKSKAGSNQNNKAAETEDEDRISTKSSSRSVNIFSNHNFAHRRSSYSDVEEEAPSKDIDSLSILRFRRSTSRTDMRSHAVCAAVCRNGQMCRSTSTPGQKYCRRHIAH